LSYSIEFINWNESNGGAALHTITNDFELSFDPEKITGIDYYKQDPRLAEISFVNDNSEFITLNIINNVNIYVAGYDSSFWEYAIRLKKDDVLIFTGWVKISSINYDEKRNIISLRMSDILSVLVLTGEHPRGFAEAEYGFENLLYNIIWKCFASVRDEGLLEKYGLNIINDYEFNTSIPSNLEIVMTDEDFGITGWDDWTADDSENFWALQLSSTFPEDFYTDADYTIRNISLDNEGVVRLVMMRYRKIKFETTAYGSTWWTFQQNIAILKCSFDSNFIPQYFSTEKYIGEPITNTVEGIIQDLYDAESYYNNQYIDKGYPIVDNLSYQIDEDNRLYFHTPWDDPITIYIDGFFKFINVSLITGSYSATSLIKMLLMINNLVLRPDSIGNIYIMNKEVYSSNIEISDTDVLEFERNSVLRSSVDYKSLLSPMVETNIEMISLALREYYKDVIPQHEYNLEIEDNYDLFLFNKIVVRGKEMKIVEIKKDLHDFYYIIKAWSIDE